MRTMLEWALEWAERGIPVFPLKPRDKIPLTKHGVKDATQDPDQIRAYWKRWPDANIGGATGGISERWVLDVDGDAGRKSLAELEQRHGLIPDTTRVRTARGEHIWFMVPDGVELKNSASKVGPGIDVRATGGYVVLPPSVHPSGSVYELVLDVQADEAPKWLVQAATAKPKPALSQQQNIPASNDRTRVLGIVRKAADRIRQAQEGSRNDSVYRECFGVGGFLGGLGMEVAVALPDLEAAALAVDQPPDMVRRALEDGAAHPRPMPPDRPRDFPTRPGQPELTEPEYPDPEPDVAVLCRLPHTDLGNARRFDMRFGHDMHWCDQRAAWLAWNGSHWDWDMHRKAHRKAQITVERLREEAQFLEQDLATLPESEDPADLKRRKLLEARIKAAHVHAAESQRSTRINAIVEQARPLHPISIQDLDRDAWLLVAQNVTIDLRTGKTRVHQREDLVTRALSVEYRPAASAPLWTSFIQNVLPNQEVRMFVQRALGNALTGDISWQRWYLFTGEGSNGKSTLLETIRWLLGRYGTTLPSGFLEQKPYEQHATEMIDLQGARFAVGSEPQGEGKWDAERIKRITGGETVKARAMRQDFYEFEPTAKMFVAANRRPRTTDLTFGFWRRIVLVPFEVQFKGEKVDHELGAKLRSEGPGILNWCIDGLRDCMEGGLRVPAVCEAAASEYQQEQDHVARFIAERCVVEYTAKDRSGALYVAFQRWYSEQGLAERPVSAVQFGRRLGKVPGVSAYDGARRTRMWSGIRLVETVMDPELQAGWNDAN